MDPLNEHGVRPSLMREWNNLLHLVTNISHSRMMWMDNYKKWQLSPLIPNPSLNGRDFLYPDFIYARMNIQQQIMFTIIELKVCHFNTGTPMYTYCVDKGFQLRPDEMFVNTDHPDYNIVGSDNTNLRMYDAVCQANASKHLFDGMIMDLIMDQSFQPVPVMQPVNPAVMSATGMQPATQKLRFSQAIVVVAVLDPQTLRVIRFEWSDVIR